MRRFVGIDLGDEQAPDETTILRFRHLLERHQVTEAMFGAVGALLEARGLVLKAGTIVDATILSAPSSTKNASGQRDPEMKQTRKGNTWYFGMKVHVGTDLRGVVHTVTTTDAGHSDLGQMPQLLHGEERVVYGDRAYWSEEDRQACEAAGITYRVNRRGRRNHPISEHWRGINRARSRVRAMGEHTFLVVKHLWGFQKVRYRGLAKNTVRVFAVFALANLYRLRHDLSPTRARCLC
jgi:transposase, IS5 family